MNDKIYNALQLRELFHIEFLRWLSRKIKPSFYIVKGGTNLRLFFKSIRYSEDMDLDIRGIELFKLKDAVMDILKAPSFAMTLRPFGVNNVIYPDISKAKQTSTTQRFKVHLATYAGEDLFTKIEFSRRASDEEALVQSVDSSILREYRLAPLIIPHYGLLSAISQKIEALACRSVVQARDVFDIYILSSQYNTPENDKLCVDPAKSRQARKNVFAIAFEDFRDSVLSYLCLDDQSLYNSADAWDDIKLKVSGFIEEVEQRNEK
jgi:predicted nucleotidyltransferase component of viral defense system